MTTAADIAAAARSMIGTPFVHQGRVPGAGLDCSGLAICTAAKCGIKIRDVPNYRRSPRPAQMIAILEEHLDRVAIDDARVGDVGFFWVLKPELPQHVGIIVDRPGGLAVVHAVADMKRAVEHVLSGFWRERLLRVYRFRGLDT